MGRHVTVIKSETEDITTDPTAVRRRIRYHCGQLRPYKFNNLHVAFSKT
jgi:hypothetical protein